MSESDRSDSSNAISGNPLQAILEVSAALVSSREYRAVLSTVAEKIGRAMSVWSVGISSYDADRDVCVFEGWWCLGGSTQEDLDYIGTVADLRERPDLRRIIETPGVRVERVDDLSLPALNREQMAKWGIKTEVDVTLRVGGRAIGMIGLEEHRFVRDFTPVELDLFAKLCDLAAIGIYNAMVHSREQERTRHLRSLLAVSHSLAAADTARCDLFPAIAESAATAMGAPRAVVYEYDPARDELVTRGVYHADDVEGYDTVGSAETVEDALGDRALLTARDPFVEHVSDPAMAADTREVLERWGEKTCLNLPMVYRNEPLGYLMLAWTEREHQLTSDELHLCTGIADQAAAALENVRRAGAAGPGGSPGRR
jgi:GAF domain-containing protein